MRHFVILLVLCPGHMGVSLVGWSKQKTLMHKLEREVTLVDKIPKPFASMIDGMVLVRLLNYIGLTYNEFADNILKFLATINFGVSRIDIVFDVYQSDSVKNAERAQCSVGKI